MAYKEEILSLLRESVGSEREEKVQRNVAHKVELFKRIDMLYALILKKSAKEPFVGVLFEGSISHILHTMMLCALHIPRDDIALFYARCIEIIESGLNKMTMSYKMLAMSHSNNSL